jgi:glutamate-1-semialdehyde 2,1-aminomutase
MGVVPPLPGFLEGLRAVCDEYGAVLIFDEVITGFRVALGGAQERYGVTPDLTTLGKIIGGGFPVGAFGGKREVMEALAPVGPVYQAGTLSGNPVAVVAGLALIDALREPGVYERLEQAGARFASGMCRAAEAAGVATCCTRVGSMSCVFFTRENVVDWTSAATSDTGTYARYFRGMLDRGFTLAPSQFEAAFVGLAHTDDDIDAAIAAAADVLSSRA